MCAHMGVRVLLAMSVKAESHKVYFNHIIPRTQPSNLGKNTVWEADKPALNTKAE